MRALYTISRYIIGLLFIFSGFAKLMDPVGSGLIIGEYFKIIGVYNLALFPIVAGLVLSLIELSIGLALTAAIRVKLFTTLALLSLLFFGILTLFLAIFDPITDCGCFGELLKLTNWQTFFKNLLFIPIALFLFFKRREYQIEGSYKIEWIVLSFTIFLFALFGVGSYLYTPIIDTMEYKRGVSLREKAAIGVGEDSPIAETILIYSKDGVEYNFTLDNLPDSTYTFVDSYTPIVSGKDELLNLDFAISDFSGNYVTESILMLDEKQFFVTIPNLKRAKKRALRKAYNLHKIIEESGYNSHYLIGTHLDQEESAKNALLPLDALFYTDSKVLLSLNRATIGVTFVNEGRVVAKYSLLAFSKKRLEKLLKEDSELIVARGDIRSNLTIQLLPLIILSIVLLMRWSVIYFRRQTAIPKEF